MNAGENRSCQNFLVAYKCLMFWKDASLCIAEIYDYFDEALSVHQFIQHLVAMVSVVGMNHAN
jgi:hypothetical protein